MLDYFSIFSRWVLVVNMYFLILHPCDQLQKGKGEM